MYVSLLRKKFKNLENKTKELSTTILFWGEKSVKNKNYRMEQLKKIEGW